MAQTVDLATPQPPQLPPIMPLVIAALKAFLGSQWFHTFLNAFLSGAATLYMAKQALPNIIPDLLKPPPHRLLPKPKKAEDAIGKIIFGNAGCTATIIGPVYHDDAELSILTAGHCVKVGAVGHMTLKDGRKLEVKCVSRDPKCDAAWLTAKNPGGDVPYLLLAEQAPQDGEVVWHQGYGIDKPGNRESGVFRGLNGDGLQCRFRLSVSPGDSGGGIILDSESKVISPVCCTTRLGGLGDVFGASPVHAAKIRPSRITAEFAEPLHYPVLPIEEIGVLPGPAIPPKM